MTTTAETVRFRLGEQQQSAIEIVEPRLQAELSSELRDDDAEGWRLIAAGWSGEVLEVPNRYDALDAVYWALLDRLNIDYAEAEQLSKRGEAESARGFRSSGRALDGLTSRILRAEVTAPDCPPHLRATRS